MWSLLAFFEGQAFTSCLVLKVLESLEQLFHRVDEFIILCPFAEGALSDLSAQDVRRQLARAKLVRISNRNVHCSYIQHILLLCQTILCLRWRPWLQGVL